jgi:murein DD-endopeptidase MepM/ murein hydrolase activator NlpD
MSIFALTRKKPLARSRTAKVGLLAALAAAITLAVSGCSTKLLVWNPLAGAGKLSQGFHAGHDGIDMYAPIGTPIKAATGGVVSQAGWYYGYGNYTCIVRDSNFKSCYGHQSYIFVHPGTKVKAGDRIGLVGSTGNSTGPHLHFEIYKYGHAVNPLPLIPAR